MLDAQGGDCDRSGSGLLTVYQRYRVTPRCSRAGWSAEVAELLMALVMVKSEPAARGAAWAFGDWVGRAPDVTARTTAARVRTLILPIALALPDMVLLRFALVRPRVVATARTRTAGAGWSERRCSKPATHPPRWVVDPQLHDLQRSPSRLWLAIGDALAFVLVRAVVDLD